MADKVYIPIFLDWLEATKRLTAAEKGRLVDSLVSYANSDENWEDYLVGNERFVADEMRLKIDRFNEISAKRAEAGAKGGKQTQANSSKRKQNQASSTTITNTKTITKTNTKTSISIFKPPTHEEVKAYCTERNNNVDPDRFINFYTSNGWKVGKNAMKDWKAAVRTWEKNGYSGQKDIRTAPDKDSTAEIRRLLEAM